MSRLLSQAQFARKKEVDRSTVCRWVKDGKIPLVDGKIDPATAEAALAANVSLRTVDSTKLKRRHRRRKSTKQGTLLQEEPSLTEARRQNELLKGELLRLKVQIERGDLIEKDEPLSWFVSTFVMVKSAILSFPRRLTGTLLAVAPDEKQVHLILKQEAISIIDQLQKAGERRFGQEKIEEVVIEGDAVITTA
jgi:hypothetical protein